ncbi:hypothetical protein FISHEDRAFT_35936 [Fistulina hepatica ATCC 64428]|uniref:DUF7770 domain-containing protein n=1 Tax=Fistulina hepatica ATCC 64428 TaxID=1128425 RepID=A0A0D7AK98_9AGAR|nr:hypothetical protein FISHEDRAFT_35936 [Fistulina hepatica ATCC 64428]
MREEIRRRAVKDVRIVGTFNGVVYHFRLSFVFMDDTALRFDPTPMAIDMNDFYRAKVLVQFKLYPMSHSPGCDHLIFPVDPRHGMTGDDVLRFMFETYKSDNFRFNNQGSGCLHWCLVVTQALSRARIISSNAENVIHQWERDQVRKYAPIFPSERQLGTFF